MATDAIRHAKRNRQAEAREAKAKREKIILIVGAVLLVGLLALEGPRTLKKLQSHTAPPSPAAAPAEAAATSAGKAAQHEVNLKRFARFANKDPFVPQAGETSSTPQAVLTATPPAVRTSHFVAKDPFAQQLTPDTSTAPAVAPSAAGEPVAAVPTSGTYIVLVASVPLGQGRHAAESTAKRARADGVPNVKIVDSSGYGTLRSGFWAVYSGPYKSLQQALNALQAIRGDGYISAYTRRLGH
jgi:hypothetical protein